MIRHVLFDADGVLQDVPGGWTAAVTPYVGHRADEFLRAAWKDELPTLAGVGDLRSLLATRLRDFGVDVDVDEVLENVWFRIEVDERSLALVTRLKTAGYGVHVGTNQDRYRADSMQRTFAYDSLFDTFFSSHALGVAKPDPQFFGEVTTRIRCEPAEILFVDDSERNVDAARESGLSAFRWTTPTVMTSSPRRWNATACARGEWSRHRGPRRRQLRNTGGRVGHGTPGSAAKGSLDARR